MKSYLPDCREALTGLSERLPEGALLTLVVNINGEGFVVSEDELKTAKKILKRAIRQNKIEKGEVVY